MLEYVAISFSRGLPNTGIEPGSHALQADSLPTEYQGIPYIFSIENKTCDTDDPCINGQQCNTLKFYYLIPANIYSSRLCI